MTSKMKTTERQQTNFPRIRKPVDSSFKITEVKVTSKKPFAKPTYERTQSQKKIELIKEPKKEELASKEPTIEEKFIEHVEAGYTSEKKSSKG